MLVPRTSRGLYPRSDMSNRSPIRRLSGILLAVLVAATALAGDVFEGWHRTPEEGRTAARKSGRPVFLVTLWADGV